MARMFTATGDAQQASVGANQHGHNRSRNRLLTEATLQANAPNPLHSSACFPFLLLLKTSRKFGESLVLFWSSSSGTKAVAPMW